VTAPTFSLRATILTALQQLALAAVLALLVIGWLHVPDANAFEVALSVLLALLIAAVACAGEAFLALRLVRKPCAARRLILGAVAAFFAAILWYLLSLAIEHLQLNDALRAGYLNSRFPASMRRTFSYPHLLLWMGWLWKTLQWIAAGLLAACAFACTTCEAPAKGIFAILRSARYWALIVLCVFVTVITSTLLNWTPGHGLAVESISLILRLAIVIALNAAVVALLLQSMAQAILRIQPAGTIAPDATQPRTVDKP
jgi:hypothetical protein